MISPSTDRSVKPDLIIACVVLVLCAGALVWSFAYSEAVAMLLPRFSAGLGILCAGWMVVTKLVQLFSQTAVASTEMSGTAPSATEDAPASEVGLDDEDEDLNDVEHIFSLTSRRDWTVTLAFIVGFFVALYLFGLFISAAVLSLSYLKVVGKRSWLFAVIYTALLVALLWCLMRWVTYIPSPAGLLIVGG